MAPMIRFLFQLVALPIGLAGMFVVFISAAMCRASSFLSGVGKL